MLKKLSFFITPFILFSFIHIGEITAKGIVKGKVIFIKGKADLVRSSRKYSLNYGFRLIERDTVVTKSNSLVVIKLETGDTLKVKANSRVTITQISLKSKKSHLHLHSGGLMAKVKKLKGRKFNINTPSSVAGVRGTTYYVESSEDYERDKVAVKKGQIEVSSTSNNSKAYVNPDEGLELESKKKVGKPERYKWIKELNWAVDPLNWEEAEMPALKTNYNKIDR